MSNPTLSYSDFIRSKIAVDKNRGFECSSDEVNPLLKPHQRDMVVWAVRGGYRAIFTAFGLGKTVIQLEVIRLVLAKLGKPSARGLIVIPLGVRTEFVRDAAMLGIPVRFIRTDAEADAAGIYLTNYESVREGKIDPKLFDCVSLDEAAILRGFGGTKTFREFMGHFEGSGIPRFVATATPSPNEYIELLAYAGFLDVMDIGQGKTRFFKRDSTKADKLTLHAHKAKEFWFWVSSWGIFVQKPSDLCRCTCHKEKNLQVSDLEASSLDHSIQARVSGAANATAVEHTPPAQITSAQAALKAVDACGQSTAGKALQHTQPGGACSTDAPVASSETGPTTAAAESACASAGKSSRHSSKTWVNRHKALPSNESTITATTSPATVAGQHAQNRLATGDHTGAESCEKCRCNEGYDLPPLQVHWHEVASDHSNAGADRDGQGRLFRNAAIGVQDASREKRDSLDSRVSQVMAIVRAATADEQIIIWCDLNDEQRAIERALQADGITVSSLYGNQDIDEREALLLDWKERRTRVFLSKPSMYGAGVNLQQSHTMIFAGIGFQFHSFIQAVHRIHRFLQQHPCDVHLIYTEAERDIRAQLERKWAQHNQLVERMTEIIQEFGLSEAAMARALARSIGCDRRESSGNGWRLVNADCVEETARMEANSVGLILTSIPFSTQYEYSPSYQDFGHSEDNEQFFAQMDYLTPELLRVLQPGRIAAIHVKDRIVPGGMTGLGFQVVYPFHARCIEHYTKHGFAYMGMKTIVTDVVRENNQTYRLGWTEQCKDGTKMGVGMPEYLLLFRKPPTDNSNSYADLPVVKSKEDYTRARWQVDAHGFMRSDGNRPLVPSDLEHLPHEKIFKLFRQYSLNSIYDFEQHVALGEELERRKLLPVTFMLLQPQSWHPDVWTDITRMRTLNSSQWSKGKEMRLCPMQFDLADRVIAQMSMPGEVVYDPFAGLGTVPLRAFLKGRVGVGTELSAAYWYDAVSYLKAAEVQAETPDLFGLAAAECEPCEGDDEEAPAAEPTKPRRAA